MRRRKNADYYMISVVAEMFHIHPQTLRLYEREGLIRPSRTEGNTRLYDKEVVKRIETILILTRDLGVNLAGVEVVMNLRDRLIAMQTEVDVLMDFIKKDVMDRRSGIAKRLALVKLPPRSLQKVP